MSLQIYFFAKHTRSSFLLYKEQHYLDLTYESLCNKAHVSYVETSDQFKISDYDQWSVKNYSYDTCYDSCFVKHISYKDMLYVFIVIITEAAY